MRSRVVCLGSVAGIAMTASLAVADTVALSASRDNTLFESPTGALSDGAGPNMFVGRISQGLIRRALLRFDLSPIPAGATITGVSLALVCSQAQGGTTDVALHRTLADWGEGGSVSVGGGGAPAQPGDATWLHTFFNTSFWSTPGGDFVAGASAATPVFDSGPYTWSSTPALVADVQGWLDSPATNFGWTLTGLESVAGTAKRFETRESIAASRPVLNVQYVIPGPCGAACVAWGGLLMARRRRG